MVVNIIHGLYKIRQLLELTIFWKFVEHLQPMAIQLLLTGIVGQKLQKKSGTEY